MLHVLQNQNGLTKVHGKVAHLELCYMGDSDEGEETAFIKEKKLGIEEESFS